MKTLTSEGMQARRQHLDFNLRPDDGIIWLDELVMDRLQSERVPMIKVTRGSLWATIGEGLFPEPVRRRGRTPGWRLGDVRDWVRARDALNPATASPYDNEDRAESTRGAPAQSHAPLRLGLAQRRPAREPFASAMPLPYPSVPARLVATPGSLQ